MARKKPTKADAEARREMREHAERTRRLAEKALAELPPNVREQRDRAGSNAAWLHELAEQAFAKLPPEEQELRACAGSNAEWLRQLAEKAQADLETRKRRSA